MKLNKIFHKIPNIPNGKAWQEAYEMLCGHCSNQLKCDIVEEMIEANKDINLWPKNGFVYDEGGGITCLSYKARPGKPFPKEKLEEILHRSEKRLPPQCGGCAATKGSDASKCNHTNKDFSNAVENETTFLCHMGNKPICGGWIRAIKNKRN